MERKKGVILFVHGFGSSRKCWRTMLALLHQDERITARYEFAAWDYPTKWIELNLFGRIPRLQELGKALGDEIDSPKYRGAELTLVGHSQGGLVIQSWIASLLQRGEGRRLRQVRQAIFFATPSEGSTTGMSLRLLFSTLFSNPQEVTLRVLNPDVADMREVIRERVVGANKDADVSWRIPIHAFCGLQDNIVLEASARGPFDSVRRVLGNHFTILRPRDTEDPRYQEFAELLLDPGGHTHRFEIERYETMIRVEPRPRQKIRTSSEKNPREVEFDNFGAITRTVLFAAGNRCRKPFTIRYGTRKEGYVAGHASHANQAPAAESGRGEDTGTFFQFDFVPDNGEDYCLKVDIYKGFDDGERDVHFHLGDHSRYRYMEYVLDLSAYLAAGYAVTMGPDFYLHPEDHPHGEMCRTRGVRRPLPPAGHDGKGVYRWTLSEVTVGIVDIVWNVATVADLQSLETPEQPEEAEHVDHDDQAG